MRVELNGHKSALLWFTGLSGSGKSTISQALEKKLYNHGIQTFILDGDNIRSGLNSDLGFSINDRHENIRRIGEVGKLFIDAGLLTMASFISPLREDRDRIREMLGAGFFIEIWIKCSLKCCEARDVKGLYRRARDGEIEDFTGIRSPYQPPANPEIILDSEKNSVDECVNKIIVFLSKEGIINESAGIIRK
jgi:adenylylsulfate kinase